MTTSRQPTLLVLAGATAVGKTAASIQLATEFHAEIISADSRQVYRRMNIGTAKPSPAELGAVPHHLIDMIEPDEPFSLALWKNTALEAMEAIWARGHLPMVVGGTGQYLAALLEGWSVPAVPPNPAIRQELENEAAAHGPVWLYERLLQLDPQAAERIEPTNTRRVIRALEVQAITGTPFSTLTQRVPPPWQTRMLVLDLPRPELYTRIDQRVDLMLAAGLLDEVKGLVAAGYDWDLPAMSSLGYIQFRPLLEGQSSLDECVERLKFDTHAFARRQATWFRRFQEASWCSPDTATVRQTVQQALG